MENEPRKELTITRIFDAPRAMVWKAWTDPRIVTKWWGPRGVTIPTCEVDVSRVGKINIVVLAGEELGPTGDRSRVLRHPDYPEKTPGYASKKVRRGLEFYAGIPEISAG